MKKVTRIGDGRLQSAAAGAATWPELWRLWNDCGVSAVLRPQTRVNYATAIHAAAAMKLPDRPTVGDVQRFMLAVVARMGKSPATANSYAASLRAICERAGELAGDSTCALAFRGALRRPLKVPRREPHMPPDDAPARALDACTTLAEVAWVRVEVETGARPSEVLALTPRELDRHQRVVTFRAHREGNNASTAPHRKNERAGPHYARVTPETMALLLWCVEHNARIGPSRGRRSADAGARVFPWSTRYTDNLMHRIRRALGADADRYFPVRVNERTGKQLAGEGWKAFRHLGAWTLVRLGASVHQVQLWLGDSTEEVAQGYAARKGGALHIQATFAPTPIDDCARALAHALLPPLTLPVRGEVNPAPGADARGLHEGSSGNQEPSALADAVPPAREPSSTTPASPAGAVALAHQMPSQLHSPAVNGGNAGSIIIEPAFRGESNPPFAPFPKDSHSLAKWYQKVTPAGHQSSISSTTGEIGKPLAVAVEEKKEVAVAVEVAVEGRKGPRRSKSEQLRGSGGDSKAVENVLTRGEQPRGR